MQNGHGLRGYFYEYIYHRMVEGARATTGMTIPLSQARSIRRQVDEALAAKDPQLSLHNPQLGISDALEAMDTALSQRLEGYQNYFAAHTSADEQYKALQSEFMAETGKKDGARGAFAGLPISPYDPRWSTRASVRAAGAELAYLRDDELMAASDGRVEQLDSQEFGNLRLGLRDVNGQFEELGEAYTHEDAAGLSVLMDKMSAQEYRDVRSWVLEGARDPSTGQIDRNRFMSSAAIERSAAVLEDLKSRGIDYSVSRDWKPGQIKARVAGTTLDVRLTDLEAEVMAGTRFYDSGVVTRFSTNSKVRTSSNQLRHRAYSASPEEAVQLLRFAQGQPIERQDGAGRVGELGTQRTGDRPGTQVEGAYHNGREASFSFKDFVAPGASSAAPGEKVVISRNARARTLEKFFSDAEAATTFGEAAVASAHENFLSQLNVEALINAAHVEMGRAEAQGDEIQAPEFSADGEIAGIERAYWEVLTGQRAELLRPGATEAMYQARLEEIGEIGNAEAPDLANLAYVGTPEQKVRDHADDVVFEIIGTWEAMDHDVDGELIYQRFDAGRVAKYMSNDDAAGQWTNLDNLAEACRIAGVKPEEIMGSGFQAARFKDRLITFDPTTARDMASDGEFMAAMAATVRESLETNAMDVRSIQIDDQGVISWEADRIKSNGARETVTGQMGQVFAPGEHGEIVTKYASGENALIVPGYLARIAAQNPDEPASSVEERTLLRGYQEMMRERIQYQVASDSSNGRSRAGEPTSLNSVYSQLYGTKHPVNFLEIARDPQDPSKLNKWTEAILQTEARRIRYSNEIKSGSTMYAAYRAGQDSPDLINDNSYDPWQATGGRNMVMLTGKDARGVEAPAGYFDPIMTGGATNQGIVRYLTTDAQIDEDGKVVPGDPSTLTGSRAPLMTLPEMETMSHDPFDRQQMTTSTIMQSAKITEPTGTALMTFGGWTADDPIVVSSRFAASHQIRGINGTMRDLVVGDKLSDLHGNKGVVSLIVDPQMDAQEAEAQGLSEEVAWFKANPQMDVVMSPFSLVSRRNAGAGRELINSVQGENQPQAQIVILEDELNVADIQLYRIDRDRTNRFHEALESLGRSADQELEATEGLTDDELTGAQTKAARIRRMLEMQNETAGVRGQLSEARQRGEADEVILALRGELADHEADVRAEIADIREMAAPELDAQFEEYVQAVTALDEEPSVELSDGRFATAEDVAMLRQNLRDLQQDEADNVQQVGPYDLRSPDGTVTPAGVGQMRFVVTHMAVDEKTKIYDEAQIAAGRGRKASSQLGWALQSQDCPAIMREFYGHNSGAESNLREYLLVNGLDMDSDGTLRIVGEDEASTEAPQRRLIEAPALKLNKVPANRKGSLPTLNMKMMKREFADLIGNRGGDLEMPFPLTFPTGQPLEQSSGTSWKLPVLSSHLRSGQEFDDGTTTTHDYTHKYEAIFEAACRYRWASTALDFTTDQTKINELHKTIAESKSRAQRSFEGITDDIQHRVLEGKTNIFKTGIMSSRLSDSATMVWTADPRLDIDQVALSSTKAEALGLAEDDYALVWRDPVLRDAGVRYMRVAIDDRLTGAAINPVMDKSFDGDFDGDAVAVVKLHTEAAKAEALKKLSVEANLLDKGSVSERGTHPMSMHVSLDTQVALSKDRKLQQELMQISGEANLNAVEPDYGSEELKESLRERNRQSNQHLVAQLSGFYHDAQRGEFGAALSFADEKQHLASIKEVCVDTGAKGSPAKLAEYGRYLGENGVSGITQKDQEASMFATAMKAHDTGLGGGFSQRAVKSLRDKDLEAVLEITYPVTQSIMASKHDAAEADHKDTVLRGPARELWRGRVMERSMGQWKAQYENGEAVQATREQWVKQFDEFYGSSEGFNTAVNPEFIERVSHHMADPKTGLMRNLEDDPALQGALLDQLAYGGDFSTLVEAAQQRRSIYESKCTAQFAPAASYQAVQQMQNQLAAMDQPGVEVQAEAAEVAASVVKADVMAQAETGAKIRGANRRSEYAVSAGKMRPKPATAAPVAAKSDDYEMEF